MQLFSIDVQIYATAYIRAESADEARSLACGLKGLTLEIPEDDTGEVDIYGGPLANAPDVSLSPAMTIYGPDPATVAELAEDDEGQDAT